MEPIAVAEKLSTKVPCKKIRSRHTTRPRARCHCAVRHPIRAEKGSIKGGKKSGHQLRAEKRQRGWGGSHLRADKKSVRAGKNSLRTGKKSAEN